MRNIDSKYALWLRPTQTQIDMYVQIISDLCHRYNGTPFPPHITLAHGLSTKKEDLTKHCRTLTESLSPFRITCKRISYSDEYFRSLFIEMELTQKLKSLHSTVCEQLSYHQEEKFLPHLSLYYGNIDTETKMTLAKQLEDTCSNPFHLERIDVYDCSNEIMQWNLVDSFSIK